MFCIGDPGRVETIRLHPGDGASTSVGLPLGASRFNVLSVGDSMAEREAARQGAGWRAGWSRERRVALRTARKAAASIERRAIRGGEPLCEAQFSCSTRGVTSDLADARSILLILPIKRIHEFN